MPYPQQTFATFEELMNYINTEWVTNGEGDITGVIGNNVVNGLLTFIRQSPLNWETIKVVATSGSVSVTRPLTLFYSLTPSSVSWTDNIYHEFVLINTTTSDIPLASGSFYYDISFLQKTTIPARTSVNISKAENGLWFQTNSTGSNTNAGLVRVPQRIQFIVGDPASYEGSVNQSLIELPVNGGTSMVINLACVSDSVALILASFGELPRSVTDRGKSYGVEYNSGNADINIYPSFVNGELYIVRFDTTTAVVSYTTNWTYYTATEETYVTGELPELNGGTILQIFKEILPLKPFNYSFDSGTNVITLDSGTVTPLQEGESLFINYTVPIS